MTSPLAPALTGSRVAVCEGINQTEPETAVMMPWGLAVPATNESCATSAGSPSLVPQTLTHKIHQSLPAKHGLHFVLSESM